MGCNNNLSCGCGGDMGFGGYGWIINLIIIIVVLQFLTGIFCGCGGWGNAGGNNCGNSCGCGNNNNCGCGNTCGNSCGCY